MLLILKRARGRCCNYVSPSGMLRERVTIASASRRITGHKITTSIQVNEPNKAEHITNHTQHAATHYLGRTGVQTVGSFPRDGIFAAGFAPAQVRDVHPNCALRAHFCACSGVERFN